MKLSQIFSVTIALAALGGVGAVFVNNASPYVRIDEAAKTTNTVHVVGELVPGTVAEKPLERRVEFQLKDETGVMPVVYSGPPQTHLSDANRVVVIGQMEGGVFKSQQLLVKCPSKYEADKKEAGA